MTTQLGLFEVPVPVARLRRPAASDAVLLVLAEVAICIDHCHDDGLGAPAVGLRARTVDTAVEHGWLTRSYVGDSDTEQGPRRLHITATGREQLALDDERAAAGGWVSVRGSVAGRLGLTEDSARGAA